MWSSQVSLKYQLLKYLCQRLTYLRHSSLHNSICQIRNLLPRFCQIPCNHRFLGGIIRTRDVNIMVGSWTILVEQF
jgi:hypothetical protein